MRGVVKSFGVLTILVAAISAGAQESARVNVPFAFAADGKSLPAGQYRFSVNSPGTIVTLSGEGHTVFLSALPGGPFPNQQSFVRFQQSGSEWSLRELAIHGIGERVPSKRNKRLIAGVPVRPVGPSTAGGEN